MSCGNSSSSSTSSASNSSSYDYVGYPLISPESESILRLAMISDKLSYSCSSDSVVEEWVLGVPEMRDGGEKGDYCLRTLNSSSIIDCGRGRC
jgi:hypothetical protein